MPLYILLPLLLFACVFISQRKTYHHIMPQAFWEFHRSPLSEKKFQEKILRKDTVVSSIHIKHDINENKQ
jgi:hypothetical protein